MKNTDFLYFSLNVQNVFSRKLTDVFATDLLKWSHCHMTDASFGGKCLSWTQTKFRKSNHAIIVTGKKLKLTVAIWEIARGAHGLLALHGYLANPALVFSFLETPLVFRALVFSYLVSFWCFGHFFWLSIVFLAIFFQTSSGVAAKVELSQQRFQNVRCPSFSAVYGCPIAMSCLHRDKNRTNPKIRFA
jgi:hypothetical protein